MADVLTTWIALQNRFYERTGQLAYCYSERANVGLLAAAAWGCDHIAIEEFATRRSDGWRGPGRVDLFMQIGDCALCIEAKAVQLRAPQNRKECRAFWQVMRAQASAARHQAARASRGSFRHRVGVAFGVISMPEPRTLKRLRDVQRSLVHEAAAQNADILAAYMPAGRLALELRSHPGVILIGAATKAWRGRIGFQHKMQTRPRAAGTRDRCSGTIT